MANAILVNGEKLIDLAEASRLHDVHEATLTRWIQNGSKAIGGGKRYLVGVRKGCKWFTSAEALLRFFDELSEMSVNRETANATAISDRELAPLLS